MGDWLGSRLPEHVDVADMLERQCFVDESGRPVRADDPWVPHRFVWFHRDLRDEPEVTAPIHVVHRDERLVVVDKPPFLSSIPRGRHVMQSVVVRLRAELDLPELSPLHRLDRVTSGLLMLATEARWRGPYQTMFEHRAVHKTYWALAPLRDDLTLPVVVRDHLRKERGSWQAEVVPGAPANAETLVELESEVDGRGVYRLTPRTGRTHQLRRAHVRPRHPDRRRPAVPRRARGRDRRLQHPPTAAGRRARIHGPRGRDPTPVPQHPPHPADDVTGSENAVRRVMRPHDAAHGVLGDGQTTESADDEIGEPKPFDASQSRAYSATSVQPASIVRE